MNPTKRVALYARVSTANGQQDPEMQLRELREYAEHRGVTIVGEYVDRMTGSKDSRPSFEPPDDRRTAAKVRCRACVEAGSFRPISSAPSECVG
jgi:Resolvase, N terminal domain